MRWRNAMETELTQPSTSESRSAPSATGSETSEAQKNQTLSNLVMESFLDGSDLNRKILEIEAAVLFVSLCQSGWNKTKAAELCGLNRTTLVMKCIKHGLMEKPENLDSLKSP